MFSFSCSLVWLKFGCKMSGATRCLLVVLVVLIGNIDTGSSLLSTEVELANYLSGEFEALASEACRKVNLALWNYATDIGNVTKEEILNEETLAFAKFEKDQWQEHFKDAEWKNFTNPKTKRQAMLLSVLGIAALDNDSLSELNNELTAMSTIYSTAKICPYNKQRCNLTEEGLTLDPEIEHVMAHSNNYNELLYSWKEWRKESGERIKKHYKKYIDLNNKAAKANGFQDMGEMWRKSYESDTFIEDMDELWEQVKPLYIQLHTYVKRKLQQKYGTNVVTGDLIPSHIFGNMWAQSWVNLYRIVRPYPNGSPFDVTAALTEKNYTVLKMFETADDFYKSLRMAKSDMSYNESQGAIITKPNDRDVECHASAWDFCDGRDFRIKMCTEVNGEDFLTIHHEMGHIQYYIQYTTQPYTFRTGANPGFHEAIGDTIALSVSTPQHLQKIGLLDNYTDSKEDNINALMMMALEKVAFMPFGLLIDKWRWDVFSGKIGEHEWNAHWWKLRENIQKVKAPVERTENDFDPGAKYHIPHDSQYISYFVAHILQFQLHKALCIAAKQYNPDDASAEAQPLHKCDIYGSDVAGMLLLIGLRQGGSNHWSDVLRMMTGESKLNGSAMLEYFKPLQDFLQEANKTDENESLSYVVTIVLSTLVVIAIIVGIGSFALIKKNKQKHGERYTLKL